MSDDGKPRPRISVTWGIRLRQIGGQVYVKAETDDLSDESMYCISEEPFSPGERLECEFFALGATSATPKFLFRRYALVVRLEVHGLEPGFGIACAFEERAVAAQAIRASAG